MILNEVDVTASNAVSDHSEETALLTELLARKRARTNFADFCRYIAPDEPPAAHHMLICNALDDVIDGKLKRLMIVMPPGSAKSTYATVRFPAYFVGRMGKRGIITASYSSDLADQFGRKVRNIVNSPEYQRVFPNTELAEDSRAKGEWATKEGGFYFSTGVNGAINGRRGALGIGDDLIKDQKEADSELVREGTWAWWISSFRSRLWPNAPIVLINTRWHTDDPSGRILPESWNGESGWVTAKDGEQWYVIHIAAEALDNDILGRKKGEWLWTDWFNSEFWEQTKKTVTMYDIRMWNSLYQGLPADEEGTYFKRDWFKYYTDIPTSLNVYMSGDYAVTEGGGDFTEIAVWGVDTHNRIFALDWWYGQKESPEWVESILSMKTRWDALVHVAEVGQIRRGVEPWLIKAMRGDEYATPPIPPRYVTCEWLPHVGDKAAEARSFQALAKVGMVHFPRTDWAERAINQMCKFPGGKFDDVIDACAKFGRYISDTWAALPPKQPEKAIEQLWNAPMKMTDFQNTERKSW